MAYNAKLLLTACLLASSFAQTGVTITFDQEVPPLASTFAPILEPTTTGLPETTASLPESTTSLPEPSTALPSFHPTPGPTIPDFSDRPSTTPSQIPPTTMPSTVIDLPECVCQDGYDWTSHDVVCNTHCMNGGAAYCHPGSADVMDPCGGECLTPEFRCRMPVSSPSISPTSSAPTRETETASPAVLPSKAPTPGPSAAYSTVPTQATSSSIPSALSTLHPTSFDLPECVCHDGYDWKAHDVVCDTHCMNDGAAYCHPGSSCEDETCGANEIRCRMPGHSTVPSRAPSSSSPSALSTSHPTSMGNFKITRGDVHHLLTRVNSEFHVGFNEEFLLSKANGIFDVLESETDSDDAISEHDLRELMDAIFNSTARRHQLVDELINATRLSELEIEHVFSVINLNGNDVLSVEDFSHWLRVHFESTATSGFLDVFEAHASRFIASILGQSSFTVVEFKLLVSAGFDCADSQAKGLLDQIVASREDGGGDVDFEEELQKFVSCIQDTTGFILPECVCHDGYDWEAHGVVCDTHCMNDGAAYCHPGSACGDETCGANEIRCRMPVFSPSHLPTSSAPTRESETASPTVLLSPTPAPSKFASSSEPTLETVNPTALPSQAPTPGPVAGFSMLPTSSPTPTSNSPSDAPTFKPSQDPSTQPSRTMTSVPSHSPSAHPSICPSSAPSNAPSSDPSLAPMTNIPTQSPSVSPSPASSNPSLAPIASDPTVTPSATPSMSHWDAPTQVLSLESISLVAAVAGVTDANKDDVCDAFAGSLNAHVTYCELLPPSASRRLLQTGTLEMELEVADNQEAEALIESDDFLQTVDLPQGVTAEEVRPRDGGSLTLTPTPAATVGVEDRVAENESAVSVGSKSNTSGTTFLIMTACAIVVGVLVSVVGYFKTRTCDSKRLGSPETKRAPTGEKDLEFGDPAVWRWPSTTRKGSNWELAE